MAILQKSIDNLRECPLTDEPVLGWLHRIPARMRTDLENLRNDLLYFGTGRKKAALFRAQRTRNMTCIRACCAISMVVFFSFWFYNQVSPQSGWLSSGEFLAFFMVMWVSALMNEMTGGNLLCGYLMLAAFYTYGILVSRADAPATTVIVLFSFMPVFVLDAAWRMIVFTASFAAAFLIRSAFICEPMALRFNIVHVLLLVPMGMLFYIQFSKREARQFADRMWSQDMLNHMITGLADVIEKREAFTGSQFLSGEDNVERLVRKMQRSPLFKDRISDLYAENILRAAPLHDLGKLKIPESVLNKPGKLTPEEYTVMKWHSEYGAEMIQEILGQAKTSGKEHDFFNVTYNVTRYHHERFDGKGYPLGLMGEEIPLEARIMAVCDVYEALTSTKCYKPAIPKERAIEIIREGAGTQFDPNIADLFIASLRGED